MADEQTNECGLCVCVYIHTVELFSALKRNTDRCCNMNKTITLENLTVSERSKTQKATYNTVFLHLNEKAGISKCIVVESRLMVARGGGDME